MNKITITYENVYNKHYYDMTINATKEIREGWIEMSESACGGRFVTRTFVTPSKDKPLLKYVMQTGNGGLTYVTWLEVLDGKSALPEYLCFSFDRITNVTWHYDGKKDDADFWMSNTDKILWGIGLDWWIKKKCEKKFRKQMEKKEANND